MDQSVQSKVNNQNDDDDIVEERNYCDMTIHVLGDPLLILTDDQLGGIRYSGKWDKFDSFGLIPAGDDDLGAEVHINESKLPVKRKLVRQHIDGMIGLTIGVDKDFPLFTWRCPYCPTDLLQAQYEDGDEHEYLHLKAMEYCPNCSYWRWHDAEIEFYEEGLDHRYESLLSKVREFDAVLPEGFTQEIASWIRRNEKRWHAITPTSLEKLTADILRHNYYPSEAIHVGRPGDGGVDVLYIDSGQRQWLVQVKRREKPGCSESVETIRSLLGAMFLNDSSCGMVVSTADHFTFKAYEAVNRAREKGMRIELIDRGKLNRMLGAVLPDRPWLKVLRERYPEVADYFEEEIPSTRYEQYCLPFQYT
jgi:hypothetical protein